MANMILGWDNLAETAVLDAAGLQPAWPVANAVDRRLHRFARAEAGGVLAVTVDLGAAPAPVRLVTVSNHNASAAAEYRLSAENDAPLTADAGGVTADTTGVTADLSGPLTLSTGWLPVWAEGYTPANTAPYTPTIEHVFEADQTWRYWRVEVREPDGSAGMVALQIGYLGLWRGWQPMRNMAYGLSDGLTSTTVVQTSLGQAHCFDRRPNVRVKRLTFGGMGDFDQKALRRIMATADVVRPMYLCINPEGMDGAEEHFLGRLQKLGSVEMTAYRHFAAVVDVEEWKA